MAAAGGPVLLRNSNALVIYTEVNFLVQPATGLVLFHQLPNVRQEIVLWLPSQISLCLLHLRKEMASPEWEALPLLQLCLLHIIVHNVGFLSCC